jgi:hypothetical protein
MATADYTAFPVLLPSLDRVQVPDETATPIRDSG